MTTAVPACELAAGDVHLWFWTTARLLSLEPYQRLLSADEEARASAFQLPQQRGEYIVSHALLRTVLSQYSGRAPRDWVFTRSEFGKPAVGSLADASALERRLRFNLSHAGQLAVCAVCLDADLGVDVEAHANDQALVEVADQYFSEREIADLRALPVEARGAAFFDYWTLKEAYVKARGEGLSQPLDSFSFFPRGDDDIGFECAAADESGAATWSFALARPLPGYTAAVAVRRSEMRLRYWVPKLDGAVELREPQSFRECVEHEPSPLRQRRH